MQLQLKYGKVQRCSLEGASVGRFAIDYSLSFLGSNNPSILVNERCDIEQKIHLCEALYPSGSCPHEAVISGISIVRANKLHENHTHPAFS